MRYIQYTFMSYVYFILSTANACCCINFYFGMETVADNYSYTCSLQFADLPPDQVNDAMVTSLKSGTNYQVLNKTEN